jgi:hypothetical protein
MNRSAILISTVSVLAGVVGCGNSSRTGTAESADTQESCITIQQGTGGTVADTCQSERSSQELRLAPALRSARRTKRFAFRSEPGAGGANITRASLKLYINGAKGEGSTGSIASPHRGTRRR